MVSIRRTVERHTIARYRRHHLRSHSHFTQRRHVNPRIPLTRPDIDEDTIAGVSEVLRSGWITSGPQVKAFEAKLSEHCGGRPVRAFNSGTATLEVGLRIGGVGPGHEVSTTPLTWVATSNVVLEVGARPVFVDIDPATRNLDPDRIESAIPPQTRGIMP